MDALTDTRLQLHWLVQILDAFAKTHAEAHPRWHHVGLRRRDGLWNTAPAAGTRIRAAISLEDGALHLVDHREQVAQIDTDGLTLEEALERFSEVVQEHDLKGELTLRDEEEMPAHPVAGGEPLSIDKEQAKRLDELFATADDILRDRQAVYMDADPVLLWPHHFDLSTMRILEEGREDDASDARTLTLGFSPGDEHYDEPYWYIAPYPSSDDPMLVDLEGPGHWHTEEWLGAVRLVSEMDDHLEDAEAFLVETTPVVEGLVSPSERTRRRRKF